MILSVVRHYTNLREYRKSRVAERDYGRADLIANAQSAQSGN
jgi:hypothetical protein